MDDDDLNTDDPTSDDVGQNIADAASNMVGNGTYGLYRYSNGIPAGQPKDHAFVSSVLNQAGAGFDGNAPTLADWTDPTSDIPGWSITPGPAKAGDVIATPNPVRLDSYSPNGQSLGIATGNGTSIGIHAGHQIAENDLPNVAINPIIRRMDQPEVKPIGPIPPQPNPQPPPPDLGVGINGRISRTKGQDTQVDGSINPTYKTSDGGKIGVTIGGNRTNGVSSGGASYTSPDGNTTIKGNADKNGIGLEYDINF